MKNKIMLAVICVGAVLCFTAVVQGQQMSDTTILTVTVPFNFVAGGMSLPAGEYNVVHVMNPRWIMLKSTDGTAIAVVNVTIAHAGNEQASNKLVFNRYQGKNYLSQIWTADDLQVHQCIPTSETNRRALQTTNATLAVAK